MTSATINALLRNNAKFSSVIIVGAGQEIPSSLLTEQYRHSRIVALEPNPAAFEILEKKYQKLSNITVKHQALTASEDATAVLTVFNSESFASTFPMDFIQHVMPNLKKTGHVTVPAGSLKTLIKQLELDGDARNALVIDVPGWDNTPFDPITIYELSAFSDIFVRIYDSPHKNTTSSIVKTMQKRGFSIAPTNNCSSPLSILAFTQDGQSKDAAMLSLKVAALEKQLQEHNAIDIKSQSQLSTESATAIQNTLSRIESKSLPSLAKQIENFISVSSIFETDGIVLDFHGWPISPDFAAIILSKLQTESYDAIIEFGSGTSTLIIAKYIKSKNLTTEFISFDHLEKYYDKTSHMLRSINLSESVSLIHAPLKEFHSDSKIYQYYDHKKSKEAISNISIKNRILVIVDGPPAKTGKHARYPGLPIILNAITPKNIDILLDDFNRKEEKEILDMWLRYTTEMGYTCHIENFETEKGAALLSASK